MQTQVLNIRDFECSICRLPSSTSTCSHCQIQPFSRTVEPSRQHPYRIPTILGLISLVALLYEFLKVQ